jgi:hypothetical protein
MGPALARQVWLYFHPTGLTDGDPEQPLAAARQDAAEPVPMELAS